MAHKAISQKNSLKEKYFRSGKCGQFLSRIFSWPFYLSLSRTGRPDEERYIQAALKLAEEHDLPLVATNDVVFLAPDDFEAHEIRVAIHDWLYPWRSETSKTLYRATIFPFRRRDVRLICGHPSALENTVLIAQRCNVTLRLGEYFLPKFPTGDLSTEDYWWWNPKKVWKSGWRFYSPMKKCGQKDDQNMMSVSKFELDVINPNGVPGLLF